MCNSKLFPWLSVIFLALVTTTYSRPQGASSSAKAIILEYENENKGSDGYSFSFKSSDGISREESAEIVNQGTEEEALSVRGSYSYIDPEGKVQTVSYIADADGYRVIEAPKIGGEIDLRIAPAAIASLAGGGLG